MHVALNQPTTEHYDVRYQVCRHGRTLTLEEYFDLALAAPTECHSETKHESVSTWSLTLPNADCEDCSEAEKEYWAKHVGVPPVRPKHWDSNYRLRWRAYQDRLTLAHDMLASAATAFGRDRVSLGELLALVGQTAQVRAADYGCDGNPMVWSEEATIVEILSPRHTPVEDAEYGTFSHFTTEPLVELRGMGRLVFTRLLSDIRLIASAPDQ